MPALGHLALTACRETKQYLEYSYTKIKMKIIDTSIKPGKQNTNQE